MRIAVAGATGIVGRPTVAALQDAGHDVVAVSRSAGIDVRDVAALADALMGVDAVVDVLSVATLSARTSVEFFTSTTRSLLDAEARAGVRHHVVLSIVGIDRAPHSYYAGKVVQEHLVETGAVPWTILRATQFHEFAAQTFDRGRVGPLHVAPRMRTQPIAAREVGEALAALASGSPRARAGELAGPHEESLVRMVRAYAHANGRSGVVAPIPLPGAFGRAQRDGSLLPDATATLGRQTFDEWLAATARAL